MGSSTSDQIINQALQNRYQNADKTKHEATLTIKHYPSLSPKREKFVFNDGSEKELLNLNGTIPVKYKGNTYNIPICLWLLDNYPFSAPMVFVKPTVDMLIKPSRHVDQNGKVYLPYLHEWNPNSSDLLGLIQIMIMTFAELPPVYAKPRNAGSSPAHYPTPYPTQPTAGYVPVPGGATSMPPYPSMPPSSTGANPTPYPTYNSPSMSSSQSPYPMYHPTSQTPYPTGMPPPYPAGVGSTPYPNYPPTSTSFGAMSGDGSAPQGGPPLSASSGTISEEHIRASLVSAVSHHVRERLRDAYGTSQAEVSVLRQQQEDLTKGKAKLEGLMSKLSLEQNELDKSIRHLQEKELEIKCVLEKVLEDTEPLDIDEAVTTTAPLYKQLLHAYAEDQATQDAIYYLGEALRRDVVDLDNYLKHVRSLSRRQFQLRATMNKCRAKANLAG